MAKRIYDRHGRWRNKHVSFHASEEEAEEINRAVAMSGLTKQDYLISRVLNRDITVIPNSRVFKLILEQTRYAVFELKREIRNAQTIDPYLKETVDTLINTLEQMKGKQNE